MAFSAKLFVLGSFIAACSMRVARLPEAGQSLAAEAFSLEPGGKGLNLAIGAHRLGAAVDGLIPVGTDAFGLMAEPALLRAGLSPELLRRLEGQTGIGVGFTQDDGENCLAVCIGANRLLAVADVIAVGDRLTATDLVLAQFELADAPIAAAFALARIAGKPTLLNPSPFRPIDADILANTTILVVNDSETAALAAALGIAKPDGASLAQALHQRGLEVLVTTHGAGGATAFPHDSAPVHQPAFAIQAVDCLGAGDGFTAGLAVALADGRSLSEALLWGCACGALVAATAGVFDALPTRTAMDQLLDSGAFRGL